MISLLLRRAYADEMMKEERVMTDVVNRLSSGKPLPSCISCNFEHVCSLSSPSVFKATNGRRAVSLRKGL